MAKAKKDIVTVDVNKDIHAKISALAKSQNTSVRKYVNQVLAAHAVTAPHYQAKFSKISVIGPTDTGVMVEDKNINQIAKVDLDLKTGNLHCSLDKKDFCEHIFASLLSPHWLTFFQRHISKPS